LYVCEREERNEITEEEKEKKKNEKLTSVFKDILGNDDTTVVTLWRPGVSVTAL
jgi:hypothetical protein